MPKDLGRTKIGAERLRASHKLGRFRTISYENPSPPLRTSFIINDFHSYESRVVRGPPSAPLPHDGTGKRCRQPCMDDGGHREKHTERNNGVKRNCEGEPACIRSKYGLLTRAALFDFEC